MDKVLKQLEPWHQRTRRLAPFNLLQNTIAPPRYTASTRGTTILPIPFMYFGSQTAQTKIPPQFPNLLGKLTLSRELDIIWI
jgi:hypothetical protein